MRKRAAEVESSFRSGGLTQEQYEAAGLCAWMDRQLDHMASYYAQPEARRTQYLIQEHAQKVKTPPQSGPTLSDSAQRHFVERWTKSWPAEQRQQWDVYREAVKKVKAADAPAPARAGSTTRPA
jgi:hypothetical protein